MRVYIWLYCVLGIFVPLAMLAVGNCGLVKAVRRSTRLRRQFHVRNAHIDANERVTTVLATVVVAYITLVAPAEIVLFIERQLSDEGALAAGHLAVAIDVTNVMQTVRSPHAHKAFRALAKYYRLGLHLLFRQQAAQANNRKIENYWNDYS